jgi:hypothetical protein
LLRQKVGWKNLSIGDIGAINAIDLFILVEEER